MKDQINTIRKALTFYSVLDADAKEALTALTQLEAMVGEQEPVAWAVYWGLPPTRQNSVHFDKESAQAVANQIKSATEVRPLYAAPVAQQPQARPDFADEWTGYLKDGETPFERFLRERKDLTALTKLYQRALDENERLQGQQPQAKPHKPLFADLIAQHPGLRDELLEMDKQPQAEKRCQYCDGTGDVHSIDGQWRGECHCQKQPQAEAVPLTHVLVPVDEPTDEMVDAACAAVDGLCRVDFVRAYVAAFAHLKAGYRDESYWCGWNAAIKFQQAEAAQYTRADLDRAYSAGLVEGERLAIQQAEAVPPGYVLVPVDVLKAASESLGSFVSDEGWTSLDMQAMDNLDAILAQQKGQP